VQPGSKHSYRVEVLGCPVGAVEWQPVDCSELVGVGLELLLAACGQDEPEGDVGVAVLSAGLRHRQEQRASRRQPRYSARPPQEDPNGLISEYSQAA
jgi:hypothetical protein